MWEYCKAHLCKQPTTTSLWGFSHPCSFVSFSFQPSLSWVGPYNWNVVYREQDMFLLHLIASCLDVQIRGASKALERPNGFVFARRCHGTSWKHHPEAKPLGGKKRPLRIWDSSLRMRDAVEDEDAFPISYSGVSFWRSWSSSWFRPTSFLVLNRCLFYGIASKHPSKLQQNLSWNLRSSDSVDFNWGSKQGTPFLEPTWGWVKTLVPSEPQNSW